MILSLPNLPALELSIGSSIIPARYPYKNPPIEPYKSGKITC
jgi:hypothetical protein